MSLMSCMNGGIGNIFVVVGGDWSVYDMSVNVKTNIVMKIKGTKSRMRDA